MFTKEKIEQIKIRKIVRSRGCTALRQDVDDKGTAEWGSRYGVGVWSSCYYLLKFSVNPKLPPKIVHKLNYILNIYLESFCPEMTTGWLLWCSFFNQGKIKIFLAVGGGGIVIASLPRVLPHVCIVLRASRSHDCTELFQLYNNRPYRVFPLCSHSSSCSVFTMNSFKPSNNPARLALSPLYR